MARPQDRLPSDKGEEEETHGKSDDRQACCGGGPAEKGCPQETQPHPADGARAQSSNLTGHDGYGGRVPGRHSGGD